MATTLSQIRLAEVSASDTRATHDLESQAVRFNYKSVKHHVQSRGKKSSKKLLVFIPLLFLFMLVFVVIILLDAIGSPLVTLARLATDQFNTQDAAFDARTNQLLNYKINQTNTEPSKYKIINDYRKLSTNLTDSLQKEGVTVNQSTQTVNFKGKEFASNQFISHLDSNILLAKAINDATTTRRSVFQDNVWQTYKQAAKLTQTGITTTGKTNLSIEEQELALTKSNSSSFRFQTQPNNQTIAGIQAINQNLSQLNQTADQLAQKKQTPSAKDFVNLIFVDQPQDNCSIYKTSQAIQNYQKTSQADQLSKLAALLLTEADKIRANEADPAVVDYLNKRLTESRTYIHNGEEITQKSALDSYAINYLSGNTSESPDYNSQKYVLGANQPLAQAISSVKNQGNHNCGEESFFDFKNLLTNIWNFITGQQPSNETTKYFTKEVKNNTTSTNLSAMTGLATAPDLVGEDLANAFTSGVAELMSTSAQKSGLIALTKNQAVAYLTKQQDLIAKRAAIDRLTMSPFDTNSPYTFLGSIVFQFAMISAKPGITNSLLAFSKLTFNSFASLFEPVGANSNQIKLSLQNCYDQEYLKANPNLALSSFCSPIYGAPVEALDLNPEIVIEKLVTSGNLEIVKNSCGIDGKNCQLQTAGRLKEFETNCLNRQTKLGIESDTTDNGQSCVATNEIEGLFASYFIDQRINQILNGKNNLNNQKGTGEIEIIKTNQLVIIYPVGQKSGKASVWLAGSGERTVDSTLGQGLPKYAIDNPSKINEVIIIPIKDSGGWSINYAVKIVNQALQEIEQKGYQITQLDGYGFSAGAIGIGSLAASQQVSLEFTNIYALGGSLGSHRELANLLQNQQIEKIYSFVGSRDGGKGTIAQQQQYFVNRGLENQIHYEIVNGVAHNSSQLINYIKKPIIDNRI